MSLTTAWPLCELEASSEELEEPVRRRLEWLVDRPAQHARFLNTLALMEHIGSRKIMTSQTRGPLDLDVLKHLAEEARHAYFFKRAAEGLAGGPLAFDDAGALRPASARMYFGRLDATIDAGLGDGAGPALPYLYVSLVIELRAIWAYALYHDVLTRRQSKLSLKSLLAEEELHLEQMLETLAAQDPALPARIASFVAIENRLFRVLWAAVDGACEALPRAA